MTPWHGIRKSASQRVKLYLLHFPTDLLKEQVLDSWEPFSQLKSRKLKNLFSVAWPLEERGQNKSVFKLPRQGRSDKIGKGVRSLSSANVKKSSGLHYGDHYIELKFLLTFFTLEKLLLSAEKLWRKKWKLSRRRWVCEKDWHCEHFHSGGLIKGRFGA